MLTVVAMRDQGRRRLVTAAVACHGALGLWLAAFLLLIVPQAHPPFANSGADQAAALLTLVVGVSGFAIVGWLLSRRQPCHPLVAVLVGAPLVMVLQLALVSWALLADRYRWPGLSVLLWATTFLWLVLPTAIVVLLLRFPTGQSLNARWRRYELVVFGHLGLVTVYAAFDPASNGTPLPLANPLGIEALRPLQPVADILVALLGLHLVGGLLALSLRYRRGTEIERQQMRWLAAAAAVQVLAVAATTLLGAPWVIEAVAISAVAAAVGVAVLRYRLWDLGLVLRRTAVYTVLTALLVAGYVGLVLVLRAVITVGLLPELLVTALIAIIALPLRGILQRGMDRMLFGERRDPVAVVRALGRRLQDGSAPALPSVVAELADTLRLPGAAIVLPDGSVAAAHGEIPAEGDRLALHHQGVAVGELVAARRHPREPLSGHDLRLLEDLAGQLGVTVRSAVLDEAVRRSHARLLAIRDEERARLRRDLHDELGPLLGGASLRVQAARNLLTDPTPSPDRAKVALTAVASDLERALEEVQRILAGLRPSMLIERGLLAALREHAASWAGHLTLRLDLPELLPPLDPAVEAAAYRIAVEGLHNAERHSGGSTVILRVTARDGDLEVQVIDDGQGLADAPTGGIGLGSMRERARLVGGTVALEQGEGGGLRVRGVLPAGSP